MNCHVCQDEAVGRCYSCGELYCARHGDVNCFRCTAAIAEGDPRHDRVSARPVRTGTRHGWWRPQQAEDYEPPACYECKGLSRRVCRHCGSIYCPEHAGPDGLCAACHRSSYFGLIALAAIVVVMGGLIVLGLLLGWN
jgi:hypothetical protein